MPEIIKKRIRPTIRTLNGLYTDDVLTTESVHRVNSSEPIYDGYKHIHSEITASVHEIHSIIQLAKKYNLTGSIYLADVKYIHNDHILQFITPINIENATIIMGLDVIVPIELNIGTCYISVNDELPAISLLDSTSLIMAFDTSYTITHLKMNSETETPSIDQIYIFISDGSEM